MDQTDRAANEALTKLFARVSGSHVDPGWLARELLAADVITASSEEFANSPYQGKAERLRRVLVDVRGNGREGTFQELVRILQSNKAYSWLGQELVGRRSSVLN